jgi:hypothetical protein
MAAVEPISEERLRSGWLAAIGIVGLAIVGLAILLDRWEDEQTLVPAVVLNLGTGIMLFAVLFFAERRLVRRETQRLVQALSGDEDVLTEFADRDPEELVDPEAADVAFSWMGALIDGRYEDAWRRSHPAWRLARAQAWLWNNRDPSVTTSSSLMVSHRTCLWTSLLTYGPTSALSRPLSSARCGVTLRMITSALPATSGVLVLVSRSLWSRHLASTRTASWFTGR